MDTFNMTAHELSQIDTFTKLAAGELGRGAAQALLGLSAKQVGRKLERFRAEGPGGLAHAARGKPGNRSLPDKTKTEALGLVREKYPDFGPTFASEKLLELHGIAVNRETLRRLMSDAGLWKPNPKKQGAVHVWRERRARFGELVQLDGSYHDWFEGRAEPCCLLAFIDDAMGRVLWLELCDAESTVSLMRATKAYLEKDGRPVSLYADRGGVYKVNIHNEDGEKKAQYERALAELGIGFIHARSPQAKGRVERLFGTLQDRLVKELRLEGISTREAANAFLLETYLSAHNAKFAVPAREPADLHRSLDGYDPALALCTKEARTLQADFCLSYRNRFLQLDAKQPAVLSRKERVTVCGLLDGSTRLFVGNKELAFKELPERPAKPAKGRTASKPTGHVPKPGHPWKHGFFNYSSSKRDISKLLKEDISILV